MAYVVKDLLKKDTTTVVYPNIIEDNIPDSAVSNTKIADSAVTNAKIANSAISNNKLNFHLYHHSYRIIYNRTGVGNINFSVSFLSVVSSAFTLNNLVDILKGYYGENGEICGLIDDYNITQAYPNDNLPCPVIYVDSGSYLHAYVSNGDEIDLQESYLTFLDQHVSQLF